MQQHGLFAVQLARRPNGEAAFGKTAMPQPSEASSSAESMPRPAPVWARAVSGAIVGVLAGLVLAVIIAAIALVLMLVMPGLGAGQVWRAAGTVMILALVASVIRSAWYGARHRPEERPR